MSEERTNQRASSLEYIHCRKNEKTLKWENVSEFLWKLPTVEMSVLYAAMCVRLENLAEAEENLKNYKHPEPLNIEGKVQVVDIHDGLKAMSAPFLIEMKHKTGTKEATQELSTALQNSTQWWTKQEVGLQAIASIGWVMDVSKARPPDITKDNSAIRYTANLLPSNLEVREESAPSGYNKGQVTMLEKTKKISSAVLTGCGTLGKEMEEMGIVEFGHNVFRTYSKVFTSLPDPEEEERQRFEAMKEQAKANKEEEEDD